MFLHLNATCVMALVVKSRAYQIDHVQPTYIATRPHVYPVIHMPGLILLYWVVFVIGGGESRGLSSFWEVSGLEKTVPYLM